MKRYLRNILCGILAYHALVVSPNIGMQLYRQSRGYGEVARMREEILNNDFTLNRAFVKVIKYQYACLDEITSPWVFVPFSFIWRNPKLEIDEIEIERLGIPVPNPKGRIT